MIVVALSAGQGVLRIKIDGREVTCRGNFDNFQREHSLNSLIKLSTSKDKEKLQNDLDKHYEAMEKCKDEEDIFDYIVKEFRKKGFRIIHQVRQER
ncbi:MAG: hypothetical protein CMC55_04135 [Flavobacteriaceae bacterium]|nr:hypothetical protein [Flavobacteriaceae bacterium]